ncbi:hypothetical protein LGK95_13360 [Clostridium algoriphilum]|uniref:hypothetical protein n=1 Tax=Clostridium algoriphilum TaxID=198347 RepID=UPI001CF1D5E8|nr:hypothetical protein [Clostridium algoriphilum]MCB2294498.1 hypothetical protein [Clostridium algoriphilum]
MEEIIDRNLTDFDINTCINKLRDLRIERLIINRQLNDLIDEYNILNIQQDLETNIVNANTITEAQANKIRAIIMNRTKKI